MQETLTYSACGTIKEGTCVEQVCNQISVTNGTAQDASFTISAQDACPGATITFAAVTSGGEFTGIGVTDDGNGMTGSLVIPTNCENVVVTYTLNDFNGCTATSSTTVFADRIAPVLPDPTDMTVECDGSGNTAALNAWITGILATGSDNCNFTVTEKLVNTISDCGDSNEQVWSFTATDDCGNTTVQHASFIIQDLVLSLIHI